MIKGSKFLLQLGVILFFLILSFRTANAIGITPGRVTLDFQSNMQKTIEFRVVNNEHKDMKVMFGVIGELADYINLNVKSVDFKANEESKSFSYTVNLPESLLPGAREAKVMVTDVPKELGENDVSIGAAIVTVSQLLVKVPYPYKYAEIRLNVRESSVNGTTQFYVEVENLGVHDLVDTQAVIEVLSGTNEKLAIVKTDTKTIPAGKKVELVASWKADINAGQYRAVASLAYDEGKIANAEKVFAIGTLEIDVVDISVKNFKLGDIAKFDITVENKWSAVVNDVYAQLQIFDAQTQQIANVKTASLDVPPLARQVLTAYWDTAGIREGTYSGKLLLNYADKVLERQLKTEITLNSIRVEIIGVGVTARATAAETGRQNLMFVLIVVLIIINIAWFIYFKRKTGKNKEN
jgi:hypothetical protein